MRDGMICQRREIALQVHLVEPARFGPGISVMGSLPNGACERRFSGRSHLGRHLFPREGSILRRGRPSVPDFLDPFRHGLE